MNGLRGGSQNFFIFFMPIIVFSGPKCTGTSNLKPIGRNHGGGAPRGAGKRWWCMVENNLRKILG